MITDWFEAKSNQMELNSGSPYLAHFHTTIAKHFSTMLVYYRIMTSSKELTMLQILIYSTSKSDQNWWNGTCMNFQPLGFYFINSPLRPFFRDFQIKPPSQIWPPCHYPLTHRKKLAKRQYTTVRGFRKCLWGIPGAAGLARNPDTNSMVLLFWDGGSIYKSSIK